LTIRFGFVFTKETGKVSTCSGTVAEIGSFLQWMLHATGTILTTVAVHACSEKGCHDLMPCCCKYSIDGMNLAEEQRFDFFQRVGGKLFAR
jgi:hypothetical protein